MRDVSEVLLRVQELCESRGGHPGLSVLISLTLYAFCGRKATHAPSIAFRHLPPNSARFSYGQRPLKGGSGTNMTAEAT